MSYLSLSKKMFFSFFFLSAFIFPFTAQAGVVYTNGFDSMATGLANGDAVESAWATRYSKGPDEGRLNIVSGGSNVRSGKAGEVKYPKGGTQTSGSGATWETDIKYSAEELYLSYWVKMGSGFDFVKGGKLPGLAGSTSFPRGTNSWSARLMWRVDGKLEFYLHGFNMNNSQGREPYRVYWDDFGSHAKLVAGRWHRIEMRIKMNTPGKRDGLLEGWLDGKLVCRDSDNANMRASGQGATKINHLFFSTFFGGSSDSSWQAKKNEVAYFDDFVVSTTRN